MKWWRRLSLRARLMLIGIVGLCAGLALGGLALVAALGLVLQRSVDAEAERTARDVAALVNYGNLPEPVPVAGAHLVQVVDSQGRVRSASLDADRLVPILYPDELPRARAGERLFIDGDRLGVEGPVRAVAQAAGPVDDPQTVIVARPMADVVRGLGLLRTTLLVVYPLLVLALAGVAWRVIGATLRPVEALRRGAEDITFTGGASAGDSGHLPVPEAQDEIHRLAATLNGMLDRLNAGRIRQREFIGDAAHELRSPLANMRTQLEVAQRLADKADWPTVAEDLLMDTARLSRLVDDLLLLARSDETTGPVRAEPVELGSLVSEVAERYPKTTVDDGAGECWVQGEPEALRRIVSNLLDNATRHAKSTVSVTVRPAGAYQVLVVADDGPGIPAEDRSRVFERFTRLDDARARDAGGAGLGLAIVRELVRRHGGTVSLDGVSPSGLKVEVEPRRPPRRSASSQVDLEEL